jgi:hypothetical protein
MHFTAQIVFIENKVLSLDYCKDARVENTLGVKNLTPDFHSGDICSPQEAREANPNPCTRTGPDSSMLC